jgi:hypothetical protein
MKDTTNLIGPAFAVLPLGQIMLGIAGQSVVRHEFADHAQSLMHHFDRRHGDQRAFLGRHFLVVGSYETVAGHCNKCISLHQSPAADRQVLIAVLVHNVNDMTSADVQSPMSVQSAVDLDNVARHQMHRNVVRRVVAGQSSADPVRCDDGRRKSRRRATRRVVSRSNVRRSKGVLTAVERLIQTRFETVISTVMRRTGRSARARVCSR